MLCSLQCPHFHRQDVVRAVDMVSFGAMSVEEVELFINKFTTPTTVSIRLYHMLVQIVEAMVLLCVGLVVDMVMSAPHHLEVVVMGNVYQETINLKRTISGTYDRFPLYNYRGTNYVKVGSSYINISGTGTVNINNIKYNKP